MMDENNSTSTWLVGITMFVMTCIIIAGGYYIIYAQPDANTKNLVINMVSIAVVIGISIVLFVGLNSDKDN